VSRLDGIQIRYDPDTLHEIWDEVEATEIVADLRREIATASDDIGELLSRAELVTMLRGVRDLDEALDEAERALSRAEVVGTSAHQHLARLRLAHVRQWRAEFEMSDSLFAGALLTVAKFGPVIEAFTVYHAGLNDYDQARYVAARQRFATALEIHQRLEFAPDEIAVSRLALTAATNRLAQELGP
jgi:hypothetical protein